jgi:CubicO group peptidase (beta-lactamase class C family)
MTHSPDLARASTARTVRAVDADVLESVERMFREQISPLRLYPGAALAVYRHGRLMLDLVAGYADSQRGEPVGSDSLFHLFSGTKPFAAVALWQQIERGRLDLDDPVCEYWPAFGANGKDGVLIRHLLSHRGGFPTTPPALAPDRWDNWTEVITAIEEMALDFVPGTASAYHFLTQHWACAELVRRLDGRCYHDYLAQEITGPLGLHDTYVGLSQALEHRLVKLHVTDGTDAQGLASVQSLRDVPFHRYVVPGASGVSTARDMARFYAAIAAGGSLDGVRILNPETVDRMMYVEVDGEIDRTFNLPVRRGLGFELGGLADQRRHWPGATATSRTFWHGGFGSSVCWGDPDLGLAMAFLANGIRRDTAAAVARRDLSEAVRSLGRGDWVRAH